MKKAGLFLGVILLVSLFSFVVSAQEAPGLPAMPGDITPEKIEQTQQQATTSWDYLSKEWQTILLKNKIIGAVDSVFKEISFVFRILFGMDYSLSLTLFIAIVFWIVFFIIIGGIIKNFSTFSPWISRGIAVLMNIVFAQIGIFTKQAEFVIWLVFKDKPWYLSLILSVVICGAIVLIVAMLSRLGKTMGAKRKAMKEALKEAKLENLITAGEGVKKFGEKIAEASNE